MPHRNSQGSSGAGGGGTSVVHPSASSTTDGVSEAQSAGILLSLSSDERVSGGGTLMNHSTPSGGGSTSKMMVLPQTTPDGKACFFPLSKLITPDGHGVEPPSPDGATAGTTEAAPLLMSIHANGGRHRILPSPIQMENGQRFASLVYSHSGSSEEELSPTSPKRGGTTEEAREHSQRPRKHARFSPEDAAIASPTSRNHHPHIRRRDSEEDASTLISPTNSIEGRKAEAAPPGTPPRPSYYPSHHTGGSPRPLMPQHPYPPPHPSSYAPPPPYGQGPPSWGHHGAPPLPHMPYYYHHHPHPHQPNPQQHHPASAYYAMVPPPPTARSTAYPGGRAGLPPPGGASSKSLYYKNGSGGATNMTIGNNSSAMTGNNKPDSMSSKHAEAQSEAIKSIADWQKGGTARTYARCIPLQHPIPSRYWGETNKDVDRKLPDFPRLVNFPDYLSRGQTRAAGEGGVLTSEGKRHCVMCGKLRVCSKSAAVHRQSQKSATSTSGKTTTAGSNGATTVESTVHIIPRQNKGVCTACDVAVWVMVSQDGLEIKWCKGCKNFRPWAAFGDKGLATKCVRCRHRQREKYASQKNEGRRTAAATTTGQQEDKKDDDMLAAQSLSTLMDGRQP